MWTCQFCQAEVQADWEICWNCTRPREGATTIRLEPELQRPQRPPLICGRCGSTQIIPNARLADRYGGNLPRWIAVDRVPGSDAPDPVVSSIHARVCGQCGLIEWYADDPLALWAIAERR